MRFIEFNYLIVLSTYFSIENLVSSALVLTISSISSSRVTDLTQCNIISPDIDACIDITLYKHQYVLNRFNIIYLNLFGSVLMNSGTLLLTLSLIDNPLNIA